MQEVVNMDEDDRKVERKHFMLGVYERRAEVTVNKRLMEIRLMSYGVTLLQNEHSSLLAMFD